MDTQKTKVIFRKWNKDIDPKQGIIAIFPEDIVTLSICDCDSWERVGEYGDLNVWSPCNPEVVIKGSKPATESEYLEDKNYLEDYYGYNLKVLKRVPRTAIKVRSKIIAQQEGIMTQENKREYWFCVKVRDKDGKLIPSDETTDNYRISFDLAELTDKQVISLLKSTGKTLKAWMPDRKITLKAYVLDWISGTYMCLFSWYDDEVEKVVKH